MVAPFAYELGVFAPTFPGITLHIPNEATWEKVREVSLLVYGLLAGDLLSRDPGMSLKDLDPMQSMERLLADGDVGVNLTAEDKDELGERFIATDPDNAVANLAIATAFEHERRHFHDWLLSPYTAAINAMRAEVFLNYAELRRPLTDGTTVIPVPLLRWLQKSEGERRALEDMWQSLLGSADQIHLPDLTHPEVTATIEGISRRYRSIGVLFEPVAGTQIDGAAIFEASALLIQTQAIHDLFGDTANSLFISTMAELPPPSRYGWFLRAMSALCRPGEVLENNTLSAIATWCLLGNNTADTENAHPLLRVEHAMQFVQARGFTNLTLPTAEIFDGLDRSSGAMPWRDLLEHSIALGDSVVEQLEHLAVEGSNFHAAIVQAHKVLHDCHVYMAHLLLQDADIYCQPVAYLDRALGRLPEPPFRETFGRPFHSVKRSTLDKFERVVLFEEASTPDEAVIQQCIGQLPNGVIDVGIADNWQYLCGSVDAVFAEYNRDDPEIEFQKQRAREAGVRYIEVLS